MSNSLCTKSSFFESPRTFITKSSASTWMMKAAPTYFGWTSLYICPCMQSCMYVRMYVSTYECRHLGMCMWMCMSRYICFCILRICRCVCICICTCIGFIAVCVCACACIHVCILAWCMLACTQTCKKVYWRSFCQSSQVKTEPRLARPGNSSVPTVTVHPKSC